MDLNVAEREGATVVAPSGRLTSATAREFESDLKAVLEQSSGPVIIDMSDMPFVSSAGLRVFLLAGKQLKAQKRGFVLASLQPRVQQVFEISGFAKIMAIEPDQESALARLRG